MHLTLDIINGSFELLGAVVNFNNVRAIRRDKRTRGVSWSSFAFFGGWGLWNLLYYPALGQWLSFIGGCFICSANLLWVAHYWWYRYEQEKQKAW